MTQDDNQRSSLTKALAKIDGAITNCQNWFNYLDRQEQNTITLQKAAALARKGDREGAMRLKSEVDSSPKVYDGATLLPAVKELVKLAEIIKTDCKQRLEGDGWQSIEIAPKDGTPIMGYSPKHGFEGNLIWNKNYERFDPNGYSCVISDWTHWQPLPTSPDDTRPTHQLIEKLCKEGE